MKLLLLAALVLFAAVKPVSMEQRVYLPPCSSAWYIDSQGTEEDHSADWVPLKCSDGHEDQ